MNNYEAGKYLNAIASNNYLLPISPPQINMEMPSSSSSKTRQEYLSNTKLGILTEAPLGSFRGEMVMAFVSNTSNRSVEASLTSPPYIKICWENYRPQFVLLKWANPGLFCLFSYFPH